MSQRTLTSAKAVKTTNPVEKIYWKAGIIGVYFGILFGMFNLVLGTLQVFRNSGTKQFFQNTTIQTGFHRAPDISKSYSGNGKRLIANTLQRSHPRLYASAINASTTSKIADLISFAKNQQGSQNMLTAELKAYYLLPKQLQNTIYINFADDNQSNIQKLDDLFKSLNLI